MTRAKARVSVNQLSDLDKWQTHGRGIIFVCIPANICVLCVVWSMCMQANRPWIKCAQPIVLPERCGIEPAQVASNPRTTVLPEQRHPFQPSQVASNPHTTIQPERHRLLQPSHSAKNHYHFSATMPGALYSCCCGSQPDPYDVFCGQCGRRLLPRLGMPSSYSERK